LQQSSFDDVGELQRQNSLLVKEMEPARDGSNTGIKTLKRDRDTDKSVQQDMITIYHQGIQSIENFKNFNRRQLRNKLTQLINPE
jgi:hypothetical protein